MKVRSVPSLVLLLLILSFSSVGIVAGLVFGKPILEQAKTSEEWPQTPGAILVSELEESRSDEGTRMYSAHVVYRYDLDGGSFESDRVWFGGDYSTSDRSEMSEVVRRYPVGADVMVYYSPDDPSQSVLMPGAYLSSYILFVIGMVFLSVAGLLLLIYVVLIVRSSMKIDEQQFDELLNASS